MIKTDRFVECPMCGFNPQPLYQISSDNDSNTKTIEDSALFNLEESKDMAYCKKCRCLITVNSRINVYRMEPYTERC